MRHSYRSIRRLQKPWHPPISDSQVVRIVTQLQRRIGLLSTVQHDKEIIGGDRVSLLHTVAVRTKQDLRTHDQERQAAVMNSSSAPKKTSLLLNDTTGLLEFVMSGILSHRDTVVIEN